MDDLIAGITLQATDASNRIYVDKRERFAFYLAAMFRDMSYALAGGFLLLFYIDIMGFAGTTALLVIPIITRIWDGVNDPLLGAYYDRRIYKKEKARPIFKHTALIAAVMLVLMFFAPRFSSNQKVDYIIKCVYAVMTYVIFEGLHTLNGTAFMSLYNSISPNPDERTKVISISRIFSTAGTSIVGGGIPVLLGLFRSDDVQAKTYIYLGAACVVSVCFIFYNFLMHHFVKERVITPAPTKQQLGPMFKKFVKNKLLMLMIASNIIIGLINLGPISLYFYTYNMGNPAIQTVVGFFTIPTFLLGSLAVPRLVKRFNKRDIVLVCMFLSVLLNGALMFAGYRPPYWALLTVLLLNNIPISIKGVLYWNMVADSVDYAEWKTGFRNDGLVYSIEGCASKIIGAVGAMSTGLIIAAISFIPNALVQSEKTMKYLFYIPQAVGVVVTLFALIPYFFYDLDRKKHEQVLADLRARKEAAAAAGEV